MSEQNRGIVLEVRKGTIIVLTPKGEFVNVPWSKLPYPEVGSEINFAQPTARRFTFRYNRVMAVAACLLIMFFSVTLWSGIFLPSSQQVVAYVNIDINPSIELGLNGQGKVMQATGLNQDGELLLRELKLTNLSADKAVEVITKAAVARNFLQVGKDNTVVITLSDPEQIPEKVKKLEQKVSAQLAASKLNGITQVIEVSGDLHHKAKELGLSPGKYVILLEAVEEGLDLSLEDLKGNSITKAIKMAGGVPGQIISKAQHNKNVYKDMERRVEDQLKRNEEARKDFDKTLPSGQEKKGSNKDKKVGEQPVSLDNVNQLKDKTSEDHLSNQKEATKELKELNKNNPKELGKEAQKATMSERRWKIFQQ